MNGFDWHAPEVQAALVDDSGQCMMFVGNWLFGTFRCDNAATHRVRQACVHEHVSIVAECDRCTDLREPMFCNHCTDSGESHECPIFSEVLPL